MMLMTYTGTAGTCHTLYTRHSIFS